MVSKLINSGGTIFYNALKHNNVKDLFIYSGGAVMPLIDSLYKGSINYYVNSHEQNCGHAATGYAKSTNRTGVCVVTSGPGITNMITPLLDAKNDSTPLVVFSGQVPISARGTNAFQEAPAIELTKHVTKWNYQIQDIYEMKSVIDEAFKIANNGKKGSVHIDIPKCVSYQNYDENSIINNKHNIYNDFYSNVLDWCYDDIDDTYVEELADMINKSERPILYVGQGCADSYKLLREFAIKGNIPVTTTIHGCGVFDESNSLSLRWCGMHGNVNANYGLQEADTIIALGSRFDDRTTGNINKYAPNAFDAYKKGTGGIIHVNINKKELRFAVKSHYNINTTCETFLKRLIPNIKYNNRHKWLYYLNDIGNKYPFEYKESNSKLHMEHVLTKIGHKLEKYSYKNNKKYNITTGVGNHQMQSYQFIKSHIPKTILSSGSLGVMGTGLPYAIGVQIANPDSLVIDIDGDSSFNMTMSDLKTIKEHNLPIKIAIMNNNAQMMVTIWEKLFFNERYTATINTHNPNYADIASAFGIKSLICDHPSNLDSTLDDFLNYEGAVLCEFKIEKDICLPLVSPGCALNEMILPNETNNIVLQGLAPS
jgi:acetolactate synthase I/II/III large subunit